MRRIPHPTAPGTRTRGGFTLIELLVAAALSLVVMTVLSLAFQTGMQTLSHLKSVVGMAEQLRAAEGVMRRDLNAQHLEDAEGNPVRVSALGGVAKGYFYFEQGQTAGTGPAVESVENGLFSYRTPSATAATGSRAWSDYISFTTRLKGDRAQEVFVAPVGSAAVAAALNAASQELAAADPSGTQFVSRWAEVAYFLIPSGTNGAAPPKVFTSDEGGVTQLPLYTLYRRQRLLADKTTAAVPGLTPLAGVATLASGSNVAVLGADDVRLQVNRLGGTSDPLASTLPTGTRPYPIVSGTESGSDVLLNNVVSMTVRPVYSLVVGSTLPANLPWQTLVPGNGAADYQPRDMIEMVPVSVTSLAANTPLAWGQPTSAGQPTRSFDTAGNGGRVVLRSNTVVGGVTLNGTGNVVGLGQFATPGTFTLKAIEIKLRVYDSKNKTSRQMTVLQDL